MPPPTPVEPVTDDFHGVRITDPYRWLEEQNSQRTRKWLADQTEYTRSYFDAIRNREAIRRRVHAMISVDAIDLPRKVGNRIFFMRRETGREQPVICMRAELDSQDIPLVDPAVQFGDISISVNLATVSKTAGLIAFSVRNGGEDFHEVRFFDVDRMTILPDSLPRGLSRGILFSNDGTGFFYSHENANAPNHDANAIFWHKLGTNPDYDVEVFRANGGPNSRLLLIGCASSAYLGFLVWRAGNTRTFDLYIQDKALATPPRLIVEGINGIFRPWVLNDTLICLFCPRGTNGHIIEIDINHPEQARWRTVLAESRAKIIEFVVAGRRLFVRSVENAEQRVEIFDLFGHRLGPLPGPQNCTIRLFPPFDNSEILFYEVSSFRHAQSIHWYEPQRGEDHLWADKPVPIDAASIEVKRLECVSKDGTTIPLHLVYRKQGNSLQPRPTVLTAYGGFGTAVGPRFSIFATFLVESGCLFVVANIRGGSELGGQWYEAGRGRNRQNAFDDFISAAEWLLSEGYTTPGRLAIAGGSNAGLLVGAAMTQKPELFRAVVCLGPLLDMLRYQLFDRARKWVEEYGCAENEDDFAFLRAYSPYHNVREAVYPAVLFISGDSDSRCNPMHARKMTALLQSANTAAHPILLDYNSKRGHVLSQPLRLRVEALTDRLSFLSQELGIQI